MINIYEKEGGKGSNYNGRKQKGPERKQKGNQTNQKTKKISEKSSILMRNISSL